MTSKPDAPMAKGTSHSMVAGVDLCSLLSARCYYFLTFSKWKCGVNGLNLISTSEKPPDQAENTLIG